MMMFGVGVFLMRWLFMCDLIQDAADIQSLPHTPMYNQLPPPSITNMHHHDHHTQQQQQHHQSQHYYDPFSNHQADGAGDATTKNGLNSNIGTNSIIGDHHGTQHHQHQQPYHHSSSSTQQQQEEEVLCHSEQEWKDQCLRGILSYPPGPQRLMVMDAMRIDLVEQLRLHLQASDKVLDMIGRRKGRRKGGKQNSSKRTLLPASPNNSPADHESATNTADKLNLNHTTSNAIVNGTDQTTATTEEGTKQQPSYHQLQHARRSREEIRVYLPQLVSAVLKSPKSATALGSDDPSYYQQENHQHHQHPVHKLRQLLLERCMVDPSWGIELCWLLEAEVGRTWKSLFEHKQQTGRRLIIVMPADRAPVIAKIGSSKREAFDLLQDAEHMTAYGTGYPSDDDNDAFHQQNQHSQQHQHHHHRRHQQQPNDPGWGLPALPPGSTTTGAWGLPAVPGMMTEQQQQQQHHKPATSIRLPSSLSLKRCSHFGDTMHFIDRLTNICLDLRLKPQLQRVEYLQEQLHEMNRRLRRRMITRGDISIDVEDDYRSAFEWPQVEDLTTDMLKHSVHFPLMPSCGNWPSGYQQNHQYSKHTATASSSSSGSTNKSTLDHDGTVARVLHIVVQESRILASRERCPYMVHLEIADSGLQGNDARLYASGSKGLGATVEEALRTFCNTQQNFAATTNNKDDDKNVVDHVNKQLSSDVASGGSGRGAISSLYEIPPELFDGEEENDNDAADEEVPETDSTSSAEQQETGGGAFGNNKSPPPHREKYASQKISTTFTRGGGQTDEELFNADPENYLNHPHGNPYDEVRQYEYEQLHRHMQAQQNEQHAMQQQQQQQHAHLSAGQHQYHMNPPMMDQQQQQQHQHPLSRATVTLGKDLLNKVYGKPWLEKCEEIRAASPYGKIEGWRLASFIMKAGEDVRREALVMQIIIKMRDWFELEIPDPHLRPYLRPYTIMCVGGDAGLLECLSDVKSVDEVKKSTDHFISLRDYFERAYGPPNPNLNAAAGQQYQQPPHLVNSHHTMSPQPQSDDPGGLYENDHLTFEQAQDNFLRSLVGYSLVCYILQIKDRHNANILLDRYGHIMHIDFGFVLGDTPKMGKVPIFSERAPFKLSTEFWELLGGWNLNNGGLGVKFCKMFEKAFAVASSHADEIAALVEAAMLTLHPNSNSAQRYARLCANGVKSRLKLRGPPESIEQKRFIMELVNTALTSWGTSTYDWLQKNMNGYI